MRENMENCPYFNTCSQNLCPLDPDLSLRNGKKHERCRFMKEAKASKVAGRDFVSGGRVMPDAPLNLVPESNVERLNITSKERWHELHKK